MLPIRVRPDAAPFRDPWRSPGLTSSPCDGDTPAMATADILRNTGWWRAFLKEWALVV
jgi:hypothetical protein